jgi:hypothetical protein
MRLLIASGDVFGGEIKRKSIVEGVVVDEEAVDNDAVPETEELSLASEIAADLDSQIAQIQTSIRKLERQRSQIDIAIVQSSTDSKNSISSLIPQETPDITFSRHGHHNTELQVHSLVLRSESMRKEILVLKRRLCRLRLYLAALYGVGLTGAHSFDDDAVRNIVTSDLQRAQKISMDDVVATANNRIEFFT